MRSGGFPSSRGGAARSPRYAAGFIRGFAAAALVRSDPGLRGRPVAALTSGAALRAVIAVTAEAWASGVRPGMSAAEATTRRPDLVGRPRDAEAERSAATALLEAAFTVSPRVEVAEPGLVHLDLIGLETLLGAEPRIAQRLVDQATTLDLPVRVGVAATRTLAALATRASPGVTVVPTGTERAFLTPLPLGLLEPEADIAAALDYWGIRTLGALAALPRSALLARLGPAAARLQAQARGEDAGPFVPSVLPEPCVEALTLDWEVPSLAALAFVLDRLLARLEARLTLGECGATALRVTLGLADGDAHAHRLALPAPVREGRALLRLLLAALEGARLSAPVVAVAVEAEPARLDPLQADLFAPPRPSPRELGETLARLSALVGPDRVGAPALADTHRPEAIGMAPFTGARLSMAHGSPVPRSGLAARGASATPEPPSAERLLHATGAALVRRRLAPPLPAVVETREGRPVHVALAGLAGPVGACAGPWRTTGEWWTDTAWSREEWDVALPDGAVYRLAHDLVADTWTVDAVYD